MQFYYLIYIYNSNFKYCPNNIPVFVGKEIGAKPSSVQGLFLIQCTVSISGIVWVICSSGDLYQAGHIAPFSTNSLYIKRQLISVSKLIHMLTLIS